MLCNCDLEARGNLSPTLDNVDSLDQPLQESLQTSHVLHSSGHQVQLKFSFVSALFILNITHTPHESSIMKSNQIQWQI